MENQIENTRSYFKITGEFLTGIARDFVLDGEWEQAEDFLKDSLEGIPYKEVNSVLSGEFCLVGDSTIGIRLEKDSESEEYKKEVTNQFSCIVRFRAPGTNQKGWYRPVSYWIWTRHSIQDLGKALSLTSKNKTLAQDFWDSCNHTRDSLIKAYAKPGETVVLVQPKPEDWPNSKVRSFVAVFFESCDAPPPWIREFTPKTPLESFLKAYRKGQLYAHTQCAPEKREADKTCFINFREEKTPDLGSLSTAEKLRIQLKKNKYSYPVGERTVSPVEVSQVTSNLCLPSKEYLPSEEQIEKTRQEIIKQANNTGWMTLGPYKVPKGAFECWSLRHTKRKKEASPWAVISKEGWKQEGDDPYHTDWLLGAGFSLDSWRNDQNLQELAEQARYKLEYPDMDLLLKEGFYPMMTLVGSDESIEGEVIHPKPNREWYKGEKKIIVLPNLRPNYIQALKGASAVITEVGSSLAHLAVLAMDKKVPLYQLKNALKTLPEGSRVRVENSHLKILGCF